MQHKLSLLFSALFAGSQGLSDGWLGGSTSPAGAGCAPPGAFIRDKWAYGQDTKGESGLAAPQCGSSDRWGHEISSGIQEHEGESRGRREAAPLGTSPQHHLLVCQELGKS